MMDIDFLTMHDLSHLSIVLKLFASAIDEKFAGVFAGVVIIPRIPYQARSSLGR